jgi:hypothetical protein
LLAADIDRIVFKKIYSQRPFPVLSSQGKHQEKTAMMNTNFAKMPPKFDSGSGMRGALLSAAHQAASDSPARSPSKEKRTD